MNIQKLLSGSDEASSLSPQRSPWPVSLGKKILANLRVMPRSGLKKSGPQQKVIKHVTYKDEETSRHEEPSTSNALSGQEKEGWLKVKFGREKSKYRRFLLKEGMIYFFIGSSNEDLVGVIALDAHVQIRNVPPNGDRLSLTFELVSPHSIKGWEKKNGKPVSLKHKVIRFRTFLDVDCQAWITSLKNTVSI